MTTDNVTFTLTDTKPVSYNAYLFRSGRRTKIARSYGDKVHKQLKNYPLIKALSNNFDKLKHSLVVNIDFKMPRNKLFTKKNAISMTSMDLDNLTKALLDLLFNGKYYKRGLNVFNIDDSQITKLNTAKSISQSGNYDISVSVEIISLQTQPNTL